MQAGEAGSGGSPGSGAGEAASAGAPSAGVSPPAGPTPIADEHSAGFWEGLRRHRVVLQSCQRCGRRRFPPMPACPFCGTPGGTDVVVPGTATVYSWVGVHRAMTPAFAGEVPYTIATVDLDGGGRIFARVTPADEVAIGSRVSPSFVDHEGWTELRFQIV